MDSTVELLVKDELYSLMQETLKWASGELKLPDNAPRVLVEKYTPKIILLARRIKDD